MTTEFPGLHLVLAGNPDRWPEWATEAAQAAHDFEGEEPGCWETWLDEITVYGEAARRRSSARMLARAAVAS